jgi:hypothetical protein
VRPKRKWLEVVVFLGRRVHAPQVKKADQSSKTKVYHVIHITHRDEVETPITDFLREAYELEDVVAVKPPAPAKKARKAVTKKPAAAKKAKKTAAKSVAKKPAGKKASAKKATVKKAAPKKDTAKRATRR